MAKKVALVAGGYVEEELNATNVKYSAQPVGSVYLTLTTLIKGEVDAAVADKLVASYSLKNIKDVNLRMVEFQDPHEGDVVFAAPKGEEAFIAKINTGLANIKKNGIYDQIYTKWFGNVASEDAPSK